MIIFRLLLLLIVWEVEQSYGNEIIPTSQSVLTPGIAVRELQNAFDNNRETQTLLHSDTHQKVSILISLSVEYQIENIEIISDVPSELHQTVYVGFAQDASTPDLLSLPYECLPNKTSTVCRPFCAESSHGNREGVAGTTVIWTLERTGEKGWSRIYDVILRGRPLEDLLVIQDKVADITLLKPYSVESSGERESCEKPVWKLIDTSTADANMEPVSQTSQNVTIYFGRTYAVTKVALIVSKQNEGVFETESPVLYFGGLKPFEKMLNLGSDCSLHDETLGLRVCLTPELSNYPFSNLTLNVKGLVRLHVFGMPFYYPRLALVTSTKTADPEANKEIQFKCVAISCGPNLFTHLESLVHRLPANSCTRHGRIVNCVNMQLVRLHQTTPELEDGPVPDTVLVTDGHVVPEVEKIMTGLKVQESSDSDLIVNIPRTHHYYGQYKCRCQADDDIASVLESPKTELPATEFDQDLVFQRNYSAKINDQVIEAKMGFLELPEDPQNSYFELHVSAHSLTKKLDLNVTIMEGDSYAAHLKEYTNPTMVMAFPRADEAAYAWPIPAYRVAASEMYPDLVDEGPVSIEWSTSEEAASVRTIKEHLRIIILSSSRDGTVRAWEWQRDAHHLDMRAYYQVGESEATSVKLYLQRSGCTPDAHPERLGSVELVHDNCIVDNTEPIKPECLRTGSGFVVRFVVPNPSASDAFDLYQVSSNDSPDKQLVHSTAMQQNLQNDLLATDISLKIVGLADGQKPDETQMDVAVIVHSKVIVDNSACLPMTIALHPTWPVGEKLESHLIANETRFTMPVPNDQRVLTLDLEMRIEAVNDSHPELTNRRSLTLPNPRYYGLEVTVNEATGEVKWPAVSLPFRDLLDRFEVKVTSVNRVCGVTEELDAPDIKQEFNGSPVYVLNLGELPDFGSNVMREYNFVITPLFKSSAGEPVKGAKTEGTLNKGQLEHTAIKSHLPVSSRSVRILVVPSQSAACLRGNPALTAEFNIQVIGEGPEKPDYLAEVEFEPDTTDASAQGFGRWYTVKGLQPGRRYEVQATVHYPTETKDEPSAFYQFWTPDEVSISTKAVYVSSGASAILNCTGVVGPSGPYQKRLEWKRQDGTPLPEGNRVETVITADKDTDWTETISLIFDNVEPGQANIYGCFIRPSVMEVLNMPVSPPTARLVVSELELNMQSHEAKSGESVSVECHTQQKGKLSWTLPDGQEVTTSEAGSNPYVEETASPRGGTNLILHIPNAKLAHTGEYVCTHPDSSSHRLFHLLLVEDIRLQIGAGSSQKAGEQLLLNCSASLGDAKRKIEWYRRGSSTEVWTLLRDPMKGDPSISITNQPSVPTDEENLHTSLLKTVNSPGSDGEFACALNSRSTNVEADEEMVFTTSTLPKVHAQLNVASTPVVKIGRIKQTKPNEVQLQCTGYPAHETDRLIWSYLPEGETEEKAIPIGPSQDEASTDGDSELAKIVHTTFHLGEHSPASWPGSASPVLLAMSGKIRARNAEDVYFTPERLDLIITQSVKTDENEQVEELDSKLRKGHVLCQYQRSAATLMVHDGQPVLALRKLEDDSQNVMTEDKIPISKMFDIHTGAINIPEAGIHGAAGDVKEADGGAAPKNLIAGKIIWLNLLLTGYMFIHFL